MDRTDNHSGLQPQATQHDIAIVGMSCIFPGAPNLHAYWQNIINKVDAIGDPPEEWDAELYYDPNSNDNDRIYTKRGGFLRDLAYFDPLKFGIMPNSIDGGDPDQLLALRVADEALADAGYLKGQVDGQRIEVIIGRGSYINRGFMTLAQHSVVIDRTVQVLRQLHPEHTEEELQAIKHELKASLPPFHAEMAPGLVPNVMTGRIANRLDFMGSNYIIDAACASSLIAVEHGISDLLSGKCDIALVGGVHASTPAPILMVFCQLNALSRTGQVSSFSKDADGTLLGEGLGMIVLKRLEDAERNGDRIYALIKGIGVASDGRALGLLTPRLEGEELALRRAYEATDISPHSVGLIEAHGTGTLVGDLTEIQALSRVFGLRNGKTPWCALGSVKSMISHLLPAAGIAGLIKATLALYHRVLPPTLHCEEPNPKLELDKTPFYISNTTRPWIHGAAGPRRAGINAFGFGGINAHAILEEYLGASSAELTTLQRRWDSEVCVIRANSREGLIRRIEELQSYLSANPETNLMDLAYSLTCDHKETSYRMAIVATSLQDVEQKLAGALVRLADPAIRSIKDPTGVYFAQEPLYSQGQLAFLFPGEGSQYVNMLSDLCIHFPEIRKWFDLIDRAFVSHQRNILPSQVIFPPPIAKSEEENGIDEQSLWQMDIGAEAVFTANQALYSLLHRLQIHPHVIAGHSSGEYSALIASGAHAIENEAYLIQGILELNRLYEEMATNSQIPKAILMTVGGVEREFVLEIVHKETDLYLAMDNCPNQIVLCGTKQSIARTIEQLRTKGAVCDILPFNRAYHTPMFQPYSDQLQEYFQQLNITAPNIKIYSCMTAQPFSQDLTEIRRLVAHQWASPVRFRDTIDSMYADGVRIFVEVGPRHNLTSFTDDILRGRKHLAVATNVPNRSGITQLNHLIALLATHGVPMQLDYLYERRTPCRLSFESHVETGKSTDRQATPLKLAMGLQPMRLAENRHPISYGQQMSDRLPIPTAASAKPGELHTRLGHAPAKVMHEYLHTMQDFLTLQQEVMGTYLKRRDAPQKALRSEEHSELSVRDQKFVQENTATARREPVDEVLPSQSMPMMPPFSLLGNITTFNPHQNLEASYQFDITQDLFLKDHTLGREISLTDPTLLGLAIVPITISIEMIAEAAVALIPDKVMIEMRNIRAYRWLALDKDQLPVQLIAKCKSDYEVVVQIREGTNSASWGTNHDNPIVEATVGFGDHYHEAPSIEEFPWHSQRPTNVPAEQLYAEYMFHGPSFQGVYSLDQWGQEGIEATLITLPTSELIHSSSTPFFVTDPFLLDAAGQLIGYWTPQFLKAAIHVFPFEIKNLHFYHPKLTSGELVKCRARIALDGEQQIRSDIDILTPDGQLLAQLVGWRDKRFDLPESFCRARISPQHAFLSTFWSAPTAQFPAPETFSCCILGERAHTFFEANGTIWQQALAFLVLSRRERTLWQGLSGTVEVRNEWLLARAVAKDAVRQFLKRQYNLVLCPADIEILQDANGRFLVDGKWLEQTKQAPLISLSHSGGISVALVAEGGQGQGVGIDIESIRPVDDDSKVETFSDKERRLIDSYDIRLGDEWSLRILCAKRAAIKARGLMATEELIKMLEMQDMDVETGQIRLEISTTLSGKISYLTNDTFTVCTGREHNIVYASVFR